MKIIKKVTLEEAAKTNPNILKVVDALNDPLNAYYCNTCDGLRVKGHECWCLFCKDRFPDSDKHLNCPEL
ncbi:MAG: hypothetical protein AABY22_06905, partial [Nanoarchaeota archaeon]